MSVFLVLAAVDQKLWTAGERLSFVQLKAAVFHILGVDEVKKGARSLEILVQTSVWKEAKSKQERW